MSPFQGFVERYMAQFATYTLERDTRLDAAVQAFYLVPPSGRGAEGVVLLFTDLAGVSDRTILTGDLSPNDNQGIVSKPTYGLSWFARERPGPIDDEALLSKFLPTVWVPDKALEAMRSWLKDYEQGELGDGAPRTRKRIGLLRSAIRHAERGGDEWSNPARTAEAFYDWHTNVFNESPVRAGYGYEPRDAALICAVQRTFARLYTTLTT